MLSLFKTGTGAVSVLRGRWGHSKVFFRNTEVTNSNPPPHCQPTPRKTFLTGDQNKFLILIIRLIRSPRMPFQNLLLLLLDARSVILGGEIWKTVSHVNLFFSFHFATCGFHIFYVMNSRATHNTSFNEREGLISRKDPWIWDFRIFRYTLCDIVYSTCGKSLHRVFS